MIQMTKIPGVPDKNKAKPGMAFYEGSGPVSMTCNECDHCISVDRTLKCAMYTKMTGSVGPSIRGYYYACRHFTGRPKAPK